MYKPEFKERGLVRAVFVADIERCGCIDASSKKHAEERGNVWAVGKWYRDDDPKLQEQIDKDFAVLTAAYEKIGGNDFGGGAYRYEYKPYIK